MEIKIGRKPREECVHDNFVECIEERDQSTKYVCNDCGLVSKNKCEVYSRVVGYLRPVGAWNGGKQEEFHKRVTYKMGER